MECKNCKKNYKRLTKEGLCAYCYQKEFGKWSPEFSNYTKDNKGNLVSKESPMKFKTSKTKRK